MHFRVCRDTRNHGLRLGRDYYIENKSPNSKELKPYQNSSQKSDVCWLFYSSKEQYCSSEGGYKNADMNMALHFYK